LKEEIDWKIDFSFDSITWLWCLPYL